MGEAGRGVSGQACCGCGLPYALKDGFFNLAKFEVVPTPALAAIEPDPRRGICRKCARLVARAWALKMRGKCRPRLVEPGDEA